MPAYPRPKLPGVRLLPQPKKTHGKHGFTLEGKPPPQPEECRFAHRARSHDTPVVPAPDEISHPAFPPSCRKRETVPPAPPHFKRTVEILPFCVIFDHKTIIEARAETTHPSSTAPPPFPGSVKPSTVATMSSPRTHSLQSLQNSPNSLPRPPCPLILPNKLKDGGGVSRQATRDFEPRPIETACAHPRDDRPAQRKTFAALRLCVFA